MIGDVWTEEGATKRDRRQLPDLAAERGESAKLAIV
jgi:hypothetical protein